MGKRPATAWVHATLYHDSETGIYTIEVTSWRCGGATSLTGFLEIGPFGVVQEEAGALADFVQGELRWLANDAVELDRARIL